MTRPVVRTGFLAAVALTLAACTPFWKPNDVLTVADQAISWPVPKEADGDDIDFYLVEVAGNLTAVDAPTTSCTLSGLASSTSYDVRITAVDSAGEYSGDIEPPYESVGRLDGTVTTGAGNANEFQPGCQGSVDSDDDGLPDLVESDTGVFLGVHDTGSDPQVADTDGDGIPDGEEVLGTDDGLDLPAMGTSPLRADLLMEFDWMDDDGSEMVGEPWYSTSRDDCGAHTHRPTPAMINRVILAFASAPTTNPDGTSGVNVIADYGQGGLFTGGNLVADSNGFIVGGVSGSEYAGHKANNFAPERNDYFRYVLMPHRYITSGTTASSGQAELPGDDNIVTLYCFGSTTNVANTIMHEVGHNLGLRHGGFENQNDKPNYNSVMNYLYQFVGVETDCADDGFGFGDGVLDFSDGSLANLNENALDERIGLCDGVDVDWDDDGQIDPSPVSVDINDNVSRTVLSDHDDWSSLFFGGVGDGDGQRLGEPEIVTERPVPAAFED